MKSRVITLLTDFGLHDAYVGTMKGVILGINPDATLVDLSHQIPPQDIQTAGFQLASAYPYFPSDTIHLVVVDPGVGSLRDAIAVDLGNALLVGPNNGVFSQILNQVNPLSAVKLDIPQYWTHAEPSTTFHGRDIFAPVAAHLSNGIVMSQVGSPFPNQHLISSDDEMRYPSENGYIQSIDHFGNLITTIPGRLIQDPSNWQILYQGQSIRGCATYSDVDPGQAVALVGSHSFIEIAINQGNAQDAFQAILRARVQLKQNTEGNFGEE